MAQKEVFEVDSRELDQADKKLRSLDKLLQQTQRRASVLGKTKIATKITLEDRFTAAADKVERRLSKLQRTTVRPIVGLADGVTAAAARIRASLLGLTGTPWRVRVEGVDWDGVVGKPLMELLGNESLFMEAGKKAGTAFFQSFLSAFDSKSLDALTGGKSGGSGEKSAESGAGEKKDDKTFWQGAQDFGTKLGEDLLKDLLKDYLKDGIKSLYDKMTGKDDNKTCICICKCNCGGGSNGGLPSGPDDERKRKNEPENKSSNRSKVEQDGKSSRTGKPEPGPKGKPKVGPWFGRVKDFIKGAPLLQGGGRLAGSNMYAAAVVLGAATGVGIGEGLNRGLDKVTELRERNTQRKLDNISNLPSPEETKDWAWVKYEKPKWYDLERHFWKWVSNSEIAGVAMTDVFGTPPQKKNEASETISFANLYKYPEVFEPNKYKPFFKLPDPYMPLNQAKTTQTQQDLFPLVMAPNDIKREIKVNVNMPSGLINMSVEKEELDWESIESIATLTANRLRNALRAAQQNMK